MVYFLIAPSARVVHLVTEMQKWALMELGFTYRAQTWSVGVLGMLLFFKSRKTAWFIFCYPHLLGWFI